jgi:hypothetical protein
VVFMALRNMCWEEEQTWRADTGGLRRDMRAFVLRWEVGYLLTPSLGELQVNDSCLKIHLAVWTKAWDASRHCIQGWRRRDDLATSNGFLTGISQVCLKPRLLSLASPERVARSIHRTAFPGQLRPTPDHHASECMPSP